MNEIFPKKLTISSKTGGKLTFLKKNLLKHSKIQVSIFQNMYEKFLSAVRVFQNRRLFQNRGFTEQAIKRNRKIYKIQVKT